jgi:hypothetical protein
LTSAGNDAPNLAAQTGALPQVVPRSVVLRPLWVPSQCEEATRAIPHPRLANIGATLGHLYPAPTGGNHHAIDVAAIREIADILLGSNAAELQLLSDLNSGLNLFGLSVDL